MNLVGTLLVDGWLVESEVVAAPGATGGNFSRCYVVKRGEEAAFLKALDYEKALKSPDPAATLNALTKAFLFEKKVLEQCGERRLRRVVRAISAGVWRPPPPNDSLVVQYLILEMASHDLRFAVSKGIDNAMRARALHHIAVGLNQLHTIGIAHQDLKPSNVLIFNALGAKVGDLGCATTRTLPSDRDARPVAGDPWYAPPDLLYGASEPDWSARRLGCDAYLFGSIIHFMWRDIGLTKAILTRLPQTLWPGAWQGSYEDLLPRIRSAYNDCLAEVEGVAAPNSQDLVAMLRELCDPDPRKRLAAREPLPLQKYISRLDLVAKRCELVLRNLT